MTAATDARLSVVSSLSQIDRRDWDACANPGWDSDRPFGTDPSVFLRTWHGLAESDPERSPLESKSQSSAYNPFVSHDFLKSLEESGSATARTGWLGRHILLEDTDERPIGVVPCYQKAHSMGEYVFDQGWADAYERAGGAYYPKLQVSVPFTPATGPRLLVRDGAAPEARQLLAGGLIALTRQLGASSAHATFLDDVDAETLDDSGFLARTDQQFHFINEGYRDFEDFLDGLASRKRKAIRRERREALADGITVEPLTGAAITEADWDAFYAFYMDTGARKWGRPYLNRRFFSLLGERMADRILLLLAKRDGRPIAGALNLIGSDALYGRYWGATEDVPFLHFELCYHQAVDWAIAHGLPRVEAGAQGDHKLARGYRPIVTRSAHWIADPGLRRAVADYLERERAAVAADHAFLDEHTPFKADT
jgi:predicted N-acyltransferase